MFSSYSYRITNSNMKFSYPSNLDAIMCNLFRFFGLHTYHPTPSWVIISGFNYQSIDTCTRTIRSHSSHSNAEEVVKEIVHEKSTRYYYTPFKKFRSSHQGSIIKFKQYENYLVLYHVNIFFHAVRMLCPYIFNGNCTLSKLLFPIDSKKGGTNRFGVHM